MIGGSQLSDEADQWRLWLQRHGAALILFARQWSASSADAEDSMQAGFLKFWRTRSRARDQVAYLYTCVRGAAMDLGRSQRRRTIREANTPRTDNDSSFIPNLERAERNAAIESALRELPADQREVVVMRIWGGLTFAQIGQALHLPLATAASRYRYAIKRLETDLSEKEVRHDER
ncbi:MAG TPA: sigma-70 family RNA polymerase sigma factor [Tepidisphaeraceae bacterium]|jgi:RNA polymerase sigma-70 factor (ECF subfamily)|nr:sigma-70 family RNA polymerase sigma factor [Tepidisphaeraceae bacterium]